MRAGVLALAAAIGLAAVSFSVVGVAVHVGYIPGGINSVKRAVNNNFFLEPWQRLNVPGLERSYRRALSIASRAGRSRRSIGRISLTTAATTSPTLTFPGLPLLVVTSRSSLAPARRSRASGRRVRHADCDGTGCRRLRDPGGATRHAIAFQMKPYMRWARYYLDWDSDLDAIAQQAPGAVHRFGPLLVIDLRRAQRELSKTAS